MFAKLLLLAGLAAVVWQGWTVVRPKPWQPSALEKAVTEAVCWQAAKALAAKELAGIEKIAVLRLGGRDTGGRVTSQLADCIHRTGPVEVLHESFVNNLMKELGIADKPVTTLAEAAQAGKKMGVSGVVFGDVAELTSDDRSASVRLNLRLANVAKEEAVFAESFAAKEPPSAASVKGVRYAIQATSPVKRLLIWLAFAAILPILLIPLLKGFLAQESNAVNFGLLTGLTLADLLLAFLLCGLIAVDWVPALLLVGAAGASGVYNYWLCCTVEKLRQ
jgi:hypothetical protein